MDCNEQFRYLEYLNETYAQDVELRACINEARLIIEGRNTIENMRIIKEDSDNVIGNIISKIVAGFIRILERVKEVVFKRFTPDTNYLKKYKDIIINKDFKQDYTFTMYDHDSALRRLNNTNVPYFNYSSLKGKLKNENEFIKLIPELETFKRQLNKDDIKWNELCKLYFRGSNDEIEIKASQLDKNKRLDMWNYLYNFKNDYEKKIASDKKNFKSAADEAKKELKGLKVESGDLFGTDSYQSILFEGMMITEAENPINNGTTGANPNDKADKNTNNNQTNPTVNNMNKQEDKNRFKDIKSGEDKSNALTEIKNYISFVGQFMTQKLNGAELIYKDYFKIIRVHVKDHVGAEDTEVGNNQNKQQQNQNNTNVANNIDTSKL